MRCRILVVEDSPTQAEALRALLEEERYDVTVVRSAEAALEQVAPGRFDLVLSDIVMPGMNGYELCRQLKSDAGVRDTPVVLLTSLTDPMDIVHGLESGADNYITKPYDPDHLLARLRRVRDNRHLRRDTRTSMGVNIAFLGTTFTITSDREQILDLLLSSIEDVVRTNRALQESQREVAEAHAQLKAYAREKAEEAAVSTEMYRALMQNAGDAIFVVGRDGCIREANARAAELLGRPADQLEGERLESSLAPSERGRFRKRLNRLCAQPDTAEGEWTVVTPNGTTVICEVSASLSIVHGEELILVIVRDITARRQSEEAVRAQQAYLRAVIDADPNLVFAKDGEGRFALVNRAMAEVYDTTTDELLGKTDADFNPHTGEVEDFRRDDLEVLATGGVKVIDEEPITDRRTSETRWLQTRKVCLIPPGGGAPQVLGISTDITARKQAEQELRESNQRLQALISASPIAILTTNTDLNVTRWSPAAERIFGYTEAEVIGRRLPIIPPDAETECQELRARVLSGRGSTNVELQRRRKDGTLIDVSLSTAPLRDGAGVIVGILGLYVDIGERKAAVQALLNSEEQLRQAQKMEAVGRLAGGIAHDFNNMLTAIKGNTEMVLLDLEATDPARPDLEEVQHAADRAAALTRQLLAFSRKQVLQPRVLDLNAVIASTQRMLRRLIGEDVELQTEPFPSLSRIKADPGQIEQVIMNLAVNARDAMPSGGTLTLATREIVVGAGEIPPGEEALPGPYVLLTVSDTGTGMSEEIMSHIFEPFYTTKELGKGTGLGLSTVYGIVRQSGGWIAVESAPGAGTVFAIHFPRASEQEEEAVSPPPATSERRGSETILLVEDEPAVRALASKMLNRRGYQVLIAAGGEEALRIADEFRGPVHLLITDVVMPKMSGREVAERVRVLHPEVRVLYMSGYTNETIVHHGVLEDGIELLEKPFTPLDLARRAREVLDA